MFSRFFLLHSNKNPPLPKQQIFDNIKQISVAQKKGGCIVVNNFQMIQDLVKCLSGLHISRLRASDEDVLNYLSSSLHSALRAAVSEQLLLQSFRNMVSGCIYEVEGLLNVSYLAIYDAGDETYLVIGPCLTESLTDTQIKLQIRNFGLETHLARLLTDFIQNLPVVSYETLHQLGVLLANYLHGIPRPVPYRKINFQWDSQSKKDLMLVEHFGELDQMRRVELRYELSAAMTEAVKQGNLSLAYQLMRQMNPESSSIVRNSNPLRNTQNMCIIMNTQLRHAMEATGIHPYRLDQFSHEIALQVEKLRTAAEAAKYPLEIIRRYCELARENTYPELKPFTRLVVTYVKEHLSDNLTVKDTAKALLVNANYLSHQFHRDMGITFIDFVNRERVNQAASLLKHTNMQIQRIAATVGYNNTSYFAKQFLKYQRMTPSMYRNSGLL